MAYIVEEDGDIIMNLEQMEEQETPAIYLTAYHYQWPCTQDKEGIELN